MYELVSHMREKLGDKVTNVVGYGHLGDGEQLYTLIKVFHYVSGFKGNVFQEVCVKNAFNKLINPLRYCQSSYRNHPRIFLFISVPFLFF